MTSSKGQGRMENWCLFILFARAWRRVPVLEMRHLWCDQRSQQNSASLKLGNDPWKDHTYGILGGHKTPFLSLQKPNSFIALLLVESQPCCLCEEWSSFTCQRYQLDYHDGSVKVMHRAGLQVKHIRNGCVMLATTSTSICAPSSFNNNSMS